MNFKEFRFVKKNLAFVVLLSLLAPSSADAGILDYLNALYSSTTTATTQAWHYVSGANQPSTASTTRQINPPQIIQETEQELERGLQNRLTAAPQRFKLNKVIEYYLARSKKIGLALENRFEQECANPVRLKLSQKWTRNAATRIFFDYRRSFLELVVNACDAMQPNKESVGKFGMGFFSIFSFLDHEETNGTTITIRTTYKKENDKLFTYELKFEKDTDKDIQIGIKKLNLRSIVQPGTNIFIEPKEKEFSPETLKQLKHYVHYLDFYKPINVKVYDKDHKMIETIGSSSTNKSISVFFKPDSIRVCDTGTGIPLSVVFTKLLIPSSTTKTSQDFTSLRTNYLKKETIKPVIFVSFNGKANTSISHFLITINGVVVINKPLTTKIADENGTIKDILIEMPQITQLTLSRNEIMFGSNENGFEQKYIKSVIKKTIKEALLSSTGNSEILYGLYQGLKDWESQSAANHIKGCFTGYFKTILQRLLKKNKHIIPAPVKTYKQLGKILNYFKQDAAIKLIPLSEELANYNYTVLEKHTKNCMKVYIEQNTSLEKLQTNLLQNAISGKLIAGMNVFFVPDDLLSKTNQNAAKVSQYQLRTCLFVPESYLEDAASTLDSEERDTALEMLRKKVATKIIQHTTTQELSEFSENAEQNNIACLIGIPQTDKANNPKHYLDYASLKNMLDPNIKALSSIHFTSQDLPILKAFFIKHRNFLTNRYKLNLFENIFFEKSLSQYSILSLEEFANKLLDHSNSQLSAQQDWQEKWYHYRNCLIYDEEKNMFYLTHSNSYIKHKNAQYHEAPILKNRTKDSNVLKKEIRTLLKQEKYRVKWQTEKEELTNTPLTLLEVMNFFFNRLLFNQGIFQVEGKPNKHLYLDNKKIFPLHKINLENVEKLFFSLVKNSYTRTPHKTIAKYNENYDLINTSRIEACNKACNDQRPMACITLTGIAPEELAPFTKSISSDLLWAQIKNDTLKSAMPNINLIPSMTNTLNWYVLVQKLLRENQDVESAQIITNLKNSIFGLYDKYYNIPDNSFQRTYGDKDSQVKLINPAYDTTAQNIAKFLSTIKNKTEILEKIVAFQTADFANQTNSKFRTEDLAQNIFYSPNTLSNTPLSILAKLIEENVPHELVVLTLEKSRTPEELMFLSYILLQNNTTKYLNGSYKPKEEKQPTYYEKLINWLRPNKSTQSEVNQSEENQLDSALTIIIEQYIQEKIESDRITDMYNKLRKKNSLQDRCSTIKDENACTIIHNFIEESVKQDNEFKQVNSFLPCKIANKLKDSPEFTLKQLIQAHCGNFGLQEALNQQDLENIAHKAQSQSGKLSIGKINQSVETGSEKKPIEGSIVETLQNSIDAIKEFIHKQQYKEYNAQKSLTKRLSEFEENKNRVINDLLTIRYKLETMPSIQPDKQHIKLTIRDHIGMPSLNVLLTNFILPDYSSKAPELGNIGDMGNGSFKLYQAAEHVSVLTRPLNNQEVCYLLHITPIRDADSGLVKDLNIKIENVTKLVPHNFFGTSIKILFKKQDIASIKTDLLHTKDFLITCAGATYIKIPSINKNINVVIEKRSIATKKHALDSNSIKLNKDQQNRDSIVYQVYNSKSGTNKKKPLFKVYKRSRTLLQSYVTTAGVPFMPLAALAKHMKLLPNNMIRILSTGFIVEISPSTYEPVQSRSQLQMSNTMKNEFRETLLEACYLHTLEKGSKNPNLLNAFFPHFSSRVTDLYQLQLSERAYEEMLLSIYIYLYPNRPYFSDKQSKKDFQKFKTEYEKLSDEEKKKLKEEAKEYKSEDKPLSDKEKKKLEKWQKKFRLKYKQLSEQDNKKLQENLSYYKQLSDSEKAKFTLKDNVNLVDFFTNYHSKSNNTSFYKTVTYWTNNMWNPLKQERNKFQQKSADLLQQWVKDKDIVSILSIQDDEQRNQNIREAREQFKKIVAEQNKEWKTFLNKHFLEWTKTTYYESQNSCFNLIKTVVTPWFQKKIDCWNLFDLDPDLNTFLPKDQPLKTTHEQKAENKVKKHISDRIPDKRIKTLIVKMLNFMLESFANLSLKRIGQHHHKIKAYWFYNKSNISGEYSPMTKTMRFNFYKKTFVEHMKLLSNILNNKINKIKNNSAYKHFYAPAIGRTSTMTHELEHARRDTPHLAENVHTNGIDAHGNVVNFDACAGSYGRLAIQNGLLEAWTSSIQKHFKRLSMDSMDSFEFTAGTWETVIKGTINSLIFKLHKLELENKDTLMDELGFPKE